MRKHVFGSALRVNSDEMKGSLLNIWQCSACWLNRAELDLDLYDPVQSRHHNPSSTIFSTDPECG